MPAATAATTKENPMTTTTALPENAADAFVAATTRIAQSMIANGVAPEVAADAAVDFLMRRMVAERPTLLVKTAAAALVKMQAGA